MKKERDSEKSKSRDFVIIQYTITPLRYTIFCNIGYIMRKITTKPNNVNIKYTIIRCKINVDNIIYIKLHRCSSTTRLFTFKDNGKTLLPFHQYDIDLKELAIH